VNLEAQIRELARKARVASQRTAELGTREKNAWLVRAAERLEAARECVLAENAKDCEEARAKGVAEALLRRL